MIFLNDPHTCEESVKHDSDACSTFHVVLQQSGILTTLLVAEFANVDRSWNTEQQLSVIQETIVSLSLPEFTPVRRDWSPATVNEIHNYICTLIGRKHDPVTSCRAQLSSRLLSLFSAYV